MDDEQQRNGNAGDDERYVLEDDGASVEEIEKEMAETAQEAVQEPAAPADPPQADVAEWRDRYVRTLADFDNFRKRSEREKQDFFKYALAGAVRDLLPVLDNFDRALAHAEEGDDFHKGVLLIYKQMFDVLQRHGLSVIDKAGVPFDPNIHEAVVREEDASVPDHTVVEVLQKGYFLHDRLLRPAMVKVAVGGAESSDVS
jgi:molecular chaperone GrpE